MRSNCEHSTGKYLKMGLHTILSVAGSGGVDANSHENRQRRIESWRALEQLYEEKKARHKSLLDFDFILCARAGCSICE